MFLVSFAIEILCWFFMAATKNKKIIRMVAGVLIGLVVGLIVFYVLIEISSYLGLYGSSDLGDPEYLERLDFTTEITLVISTIVSLLVVFLIARKIIKLGNTTID